jgi:hypothetical protein
MAGFEVTFNGRFWVTPEGLGSAQYQRFIQLKSCRSGGT